MFEEEEAPTRNEDAVEFTERGIQIADGAECEDGDGGVEGVIIEGEGGNVVGVVVDFDIV